MIGIVFEHSAIVGEPKTSEFYIGMLHVSVMQFFKFATIVFFLIAGFLINHKFTEYTPVQYLKNRLANTIKPWAFWLHVLLLCNLLAFLFKRLKYHEPFNFPGGFWAYLGEQYYQVTFFSSSWFVLNFLICIAILLFFKRYIYKVWFGVILGGISLLYGLNIYNEWIIPTHTTALFGFVFFLWLGAYANQHQKQVFNFIERTPMWCLIAVTTFFFLVADMESLYLKHLNIGDIYNTLRISNVFYSLSFFTILLKIGSVGFINDYLNPRSTTFGIYLIHHIIIIHLLSEMFRPFKIDLNSITLIEGVAYSILRFIIAYGLSMLLVKLIARTKLKWSIGMS